MKKVIVGIRFQKFGKMYHFDATNVPDLEVGDFAIVGTSRGTQVGEVVGVIDNPPRPPKGSWKRIDRRATAGDLVRRQIWQKKEEKALDNCRELVSKLGIEGVDFVRAEYSFDGLHLTFLFNSEVEGDINFKKLRKEINNQYSQSKIYIQRIGPRDVAKIMCGFGACGMENRCCSMFITEFKPITIKMAKAQGVSLDPSEITGMCGRLRCCLNYEYKQYAEALSELPKRGKRVVTQIGEGKVIDVLPLKQTIVLRMDEDNKRLEFHKDEINP
jgi:cell fate regulator YaaT (PSP1 superfamily)